MKKTKLFSVLVCICALMLLVSACGAPASGGASANATTPAASTDTSPSSEDASTAPESLPEVTLKFYLINSPQKDTEMVLAEANKIIKEKLNAKLDLAFIDWGSYDEKMSTIIAAGEDYDACYSSNWTNNYSQNVAKGAFLDITDMVPQYCQGIMNYAEMVKPESLEALKYKGRLYGIRFDSPMPVGAGFEGTKEYFDALGFDIQQTNKLSDLEPFLAQIKAEMPEVTPFCAPSQSHEMMTALYMDMTNDGKYEKMTDTLFYNSIDKQFVTIYDMPEFTESFNILRDWYNKGYIKKDAATIQADQITSEKKAKDYGVWLTNFAVDGEGRNGLASYGIPCAERKLTEGVIKTNDVLGVVMAINSKSKNPERSLMLLNEMCVNQELYMLLSWGIEGEHYTVTKTEPDGRPFMEPVMPKTYDSTASWEMGPYSMSYYMPSWGYQDAINDHEMRETGKVSPLLGFVYVPDEVKTETAAMDAVYAKYIPILFSGVGDPAEYAELLKTEFEKAGSEKVKADAQKQLEEWLANNQ